MRIDHGSGQVCILPLKASPTSSAGGISRLDSSLVSCSQAFLFYELLPSFCLSAGVVVFLISQSNSPSYNRLCHLHPFQYTAIAPATWVQVFFCGRGMREVRTIHEGIFQTKMIHTIPQQQLQRKKPLGVLQI